MLHNLISATVGPARSKAVTVLLVLAVGALVAACAGAPGDLTGSTGGDSGRPPGNVSGATEGDSGRPRAESIGGTIWVDGDGDGQYTVGEATTEGVTVTLWQDANGDGQCGAGDVQVGTVTSGADGGYLFESLAPGRYCVQLGTGATATWTGAVEITAGTGQTLNIARP